jgi:hypothetical protein
MVAQADPSPVPRGEFSGGPADPSLIGTQQGHPNPLVRALNAVPSLLASKVHVMFLFALGVFLVILPLVGVSVSAKAELIGGNYTNVTSDLGACIAAGGTVHLIKRNRAHNRELAALHAKLDAALAHRPAATSPAPNRGGGGDGDVSGGEVGPLNAG